MRVIIRFSINGEDNGALRNALASCLEQAAFQRTTTATWENEDIGPKPLGELMCIFWSIVGDPQAQPSVQDTAGIDHVWVYTDTR